MTTTTVVLVRHGQTSWNRVERFRGHADIPLDDVGMAQAAATGKYIARFWHPVAIYAGPLSRTINTAEAIAGQAGVPVTKEPGLIDVDCGEWQGLTLNEVCQRWSAQAQEWQEAPEKLRFPGGETLEEACLRASTTLQALVARHPDETIIMVSHAALNRLILLSALGLGVERFWSLRQDTCAVNVMEAQPDHFTVVTINSTCHLISLANERDSVEKVLTV